MTKKLMDVPIDLLDEINDDLIQLRMNEFKLQLVHQYVEAKNYNFDDTGLSELFDETVSFIHQHLNSMEMNLNKLALCNH